MVDAQQMLHNCEILFLSVITQMLTSVKASSLVTIMQNVRTPLDHICVNVCPVILEMDKIAQVNLVDFI